jgi:hypothetical protein
MADHSKITIVRASHSESYTKISNRILQNEIRLPIEARVILLDLLSRPKDWQVLIEHLCKTHSMGRDRCYRALNELREAGFARLDTPRDPETGRVGKRRWIIFEEPEPRFPGIQETGGPGFLNSPVSGNHRFPENQDAYKGKKDKQTKDPPTHHAPPQPAREGGEGLCDEVEEASVAAQPDGWEDFRAVWPWQDGQSESVEAARREFGKLSDADKALCVKGAQAFQARPGRVCAAVFIKERLWSFSPRRSATAGVSSLPPASGAKVVKRSDCQLFLPIDSPQLQRWHEHERRTYGKAKPGCFRPSEWPPGHQLSAGHPKKNGSQAEPFSRATLDDLGATGIAREPCRSLRHG